MVVRPRADTDDQALVALADRERLGGYPPPGVDLSIEPGWIGSWVAEDDGALVGHVALRTEISDSVSRHAAAILGIDEDQLAVIKRLLVTADHRGHGIGRQLLDIAVGHATRAGLVPILDTWIESPDSMHFWAFTMDEGAR